MAWLLDMLTPERVTNSLPAVDKDGVLWALSQRFAPSTVLVDVERIHAVLAEREALASTGIGSGVAVPHGRLSELKTIQGCLAVCGEGVHFDAIDGKPVHIFFALLGPVGETKEHLKSLARVSRLLRETQFRHRLIEAADDQALWSLVLEADSFSLS